MSIYWWFHIIGWPVVAVSLLVVWVAGDLAPPRRRGPHVLLDLMDYGGPNEWRCSCGARIWPDCDISIASVNTAFEEHLAKVGRA